MEERRICATCAHYDGMKCKNPGSCFENCPIRSDAFCTAWAERRDRCDGCRHYLGGEGDKPAGLSVGQGPTADGSNRRFEARHRGRCKLNVEGECAAGGFELWEPKAARPLSRRAETVLLTAMLLGSMMPDGGEYTKLVMDDVDDPLSRRKG